MQIDEQALIRMGLSPSIAATFAAPLDSACRRFDLLTPRRAGALIGQCRVESAGFKKLREDLYYSSAARLLAVYPSAFRTVESTSGFVGNPQALANRVYANRLGNGDEASGDGWRFAGKGLIQLTGRDNYSAAGAAIGFDYVRDPMRLTLPVDACLTAAWFFHSRKCHLMADQWSIDDITRMVNGRAMLHREERRRYSEQARSALEAAWP